MFDTAARESKRMPRL